MNFNAEVVPAYLQEQVKASLKKRTYKVEVYINLTDGVMSSGCTYPRGQVLCHHIAALLFHVHYNISATGKARKWGIAKSKKDDADITTTIDNLYLQEHDTAVLNEIDDSEVEEFRGGLGHTNIVE